MTQVINGFNKTNFFLSNFYPERFVLRDISYRSVEHGYQAAKAVNMEERRAIMMARGPAQAKRLGRECECRPNWDANKLITMRELVAAKFQEVRLRDLLLATGKAELIEGNWWGDTYWGVCKGVGENHLGKILMDVREQLTI